MQISHVLKKECQAKTEIEYFLFLQELSQAIVFTNLFIKEHHQDISLVDHRYYDLQDANAEKDKIVNQLNKFGINDPIISKLKYGSKYSLEYYYWFRWWENYLNSLNETELGDLEKSYLNGEDLSEWHPQGSWKN